MISAAARVFAVGVAGVQGWGSGGSFLARRPVLNPQDLIATVVTGDDPAAPVPEAHPGTQEVIARLHKMATEQVDLNKDGILDRHELVDFAVVLRDGEREKFTAEEMARWDRNGDSLVELAELHGNLDSKTMTPELQAALAVVEEKFHGVDFDLDGGLNRDELHIFLHPELHTDALQLEAEQQFAQLDTNQDGGVDLRELGSAYSGEAEFDDAYTSHELDIHDHNKDGKLDIHELEELVEGHKYVEHMVGQMITLLDRNKDGRVTMKEFGADHRLLLAAEAIEDWLYSSSGRDEL